MIIHFFKKIKNIIKNNIFKYNFFYEKKISVYYILISIIICWFINGFKIIKENEKVIVLRFGKFYCIKKSGLNWFAKGIDKLKIINISKKKIISKEKIITLDENIIFTEIIIEYIISDYKKYIFKNVNPKRNIEQEINNSIREIIGKHNIDYILKNENNSIIKNNIYNLLCKKIKYIDIGIKLLDINLIKIKIPSELKKYFNNIKIETENEKENIKKIKLYCDKIYIEAKNKSKKIINDSIYYNKKKILNIKIENDYFKKMFNLYKLNPDIVKNKLYLDFLEKFLNKINKLITSNCSKNKINKKIL